MGRTLAEKVWDAHVVRRAEGEPDLLYIDLHLVHEVTSPQAFDGLRLAGRPVRRPDLTIATEDHNVPTTDVDRPIADPVSRTQVETLRKNCAEFGVRLHPMGDAGQGIVHVIGPQLGLTQPGMTVVCGDSHTSTHGAFGALAFGIGTSEVEHVLATQTLPLEPAADDGRRRRRRAARRASPPRTWSSRIIAQIGTGGGQGHVIEYRGEAIRALSMEGRMTVCNMSIEAGARAGMIAPDETTFAYLAGPAARAHGRGLGRRRRHWRRCAPTTTPSSTASCTSTPRALAPFVTWGTNPGQGAPLSAAVPDPAALPGRPGRRAAAERALTYMGLAAGHPLRDVPVDTVFIGSCTNGRIEDLRAAADGAARAGRSPTGCAALVVPGSVAVKQQAEQEGLDEVFRAAGAEWRGAGCSMCLGDEPGHARARASAAPPRPTATSRAGRGRAAAPTSCRRRSPPPPPSSAAWPRPPTCEG